MKTLLLALALIAMPHAVPADLSDPSVGIPVEGLVPDAGTAISIAQTILIRRFGVREVAGQMPLSARLTDDVWSVEGTISSGTFGRAIQIEISKRDSRVLRIGFGKHNPQLQ